MDLMNLMDLMDLETNAIGFEGIESTNVQEEMGIGWNPIPIPPLHSLSFW